MILDSIPRDECIVQPALGAQWGPSNLGRRLAAGAPPQTADTAYAIPWLFPAGSAQSMGSGRPG
eukprot:CAMPEP_0196571892 /NCGR_PEP_ID=MMETSP1081-20130531/2027_1 /TAXON_ID=36882 /ORGANISM="Pyramimonas amylifera, Strain CCMP720" /LENGTH=63 /DNA_ID=CAMNT_0041889021 /DNA_START=205 /DNA_END=396 /DNA_ORIENTATION=+